MKLKSLLVGAVLVVSTLGCSSPQKILLNDGTVIETRDEVDYDKKTGFYEYEDQDGKEAIVNSSEIKIIEEKN